MRWLKHMLTVGLLLAAGVLVLATVFSNHNSEYGKVALPWGGVVHLPKGTTTVSTAGTAPMLNSRGRPRLPGRPDCGAIRSR
jgi:hypothetical protein